MKTLLTLFVLFFSSSVFADNISDFEIEGMSIGDSLLDYFSEEEIKSKKKFPYPDKNYVGIVFSNLSFYQNYETVQFTYNLNENYKIIRISGKVYFKDNINDCYRQKDEIVSEISGIFSKNVKIENFKEALSKRADKSGKSFGTTTNFYLNPNEKGDFVQVMCRDYSEEVKRKDALNVEIWAKEYTEYRKTLK